MSYANLDNFPCKRTSLFSSGYSYQAEKPSEPQELPNTVFRSVDLNDIELDAKGQLFVHLKEHIEQRFKSILPVPCPDDRWDVEGWFDMIDEKFDLVHKIYEKGRDVIRQEGEVVQRELDSINKKCESEKTKGE